MTNLHVSCTPFCTPAPLNLDDAQIMPDTTSSLLLQEAADAVLQFLEQSQHEAGAQTSPLVLAAVRSLGRWGAQHWIRVLARSTHAELFRLIGICYVLV